MYCFSKAIQWPHLYNYGTHPTYKELLGSKANLEKKNAWKYVAVYLRQLKMG